MQKYDYLIVGCGFFGATLARRILEQKKTVLIIDKRNHIGGNAYTERVGGIDIHKYGAHIFHTNNDKIWNFITQFGEFNNYQHKVVAKVNNKMYSLPFNMWTFNQMWGIDKPEDAIKIIDSQKEYNTPSNLEEQAISMVGKDIYNRLIKEYTTKQWNKDPKQLPASIIKRIPVKFTYDDRYFSDKHQGIPIDGYTKIIENMIDGSTVALEEDYFNKRDYFNSICKNIIYTGPIDRLFDYTYGKLEYRSLFFENELIIKNNYQGNSVINYPSLDIAYTRIIEHKHFNNRNDIVNLDKTIITKEYPADYTTNNEPYYPINDENNQKIYQKYKQIAINTNILVGGRLGEYKYYDMHQAIGSALSVEF